MKDDVFSEIMSILILGSVPAAIVTLRHDVDTLFEFMSESVPPDEVVFYFAALTIFHFLVWAVGKYVYQPSESARRIVNLVHKVSDQVGFALLGLYSVITGILIFAVAPILLVEPTMNNLVPVLSVLFWCGSFTIMCFGLSFTQKKTRAHEPTHF